MKPRNKIACLPERLRTRLNLRLQNDEPVPQLLAWLNSRHEVKARPDTPDSQINESDLDAWRRTGFRAWEERQDELDAVRFCRADSAAFAGASSNDIAEQLVQILTAQIALLLRRPPIEPQAAPSANSPVATCDPSLPAFGSRTSVGERVRREGFVPPTVFVSSAPPSRRSQRQSPPDEWERLHFLVTSLTSLRRTDFTAYHRQLERQDLDVALQELAREESAFQKRVEEDKIPIKERLKNKHITDEERDRVWRGLMSL